MFKCCVCNKSSKKSKRDKRNNESDPSSQEPAGSPEIENVQKNGIKLSSSSERLNGDATKIVNITTSLPNSPRDNSDNHEKSDATSDPESTKKRDEIKEEKRLESLPTSIEENSSVKTTSECSTREITDTNVGGEFNAVQENRQTIPKLGCLYAPAYIERTMVDGPDEDGDDSVFEAPVGQDEPDPPVTEGCETDGREEHLEELVTRLENVTKRLESVPTKLITQTQETAVQTKTPSPKRPNRSNGEHSTVTSSSIESAIVTETAKSMSVASYEDLVAGPVSEYLKLSQKIGGDVASHSKLVDKAFQIQLQFIRTASSRPAPAGQSEQVSLLGPTSTTIQEIQEFREKNRGSQFFNHLSAISESIPALGWVAVSPTPAPYVKEMNDAGQFYTNRVLKDWKEKDKTHVEWCKAWVQTLSELQQYVRKNHTTGLVWAKTGSAPVPPPLGGMPPPPPPAMMPLGDVLGNVNDDRSALFAQINQGEDITRTLKKVTSEMQTHKNSSLRTGPAPFKAPVTSNAANEGPKKSVPPANAPIDKPPVFTRDGKKWLVEYHKGNKDLFVDNAEMNNVVYMFRCQDSTMTVKGKINSIVIDSCRKSSIVFDSLVSSIEFVNCQSVQMQVLGKVPTISIDKTDGCQMYLSPNSLDVTLISSKSSEMNVMVPKGNGDYVEYPVPEQFKTTISSNGLSTTAVDSLG